MGKLSAQGINVCQTPRPGHIYIIGAKSLRAVPGLPRLAFSRPKKQIWHFLKLVSLKNFENLLSSWPLFKSI